MKAVVKPILTIIVSSLIVSALSLPLNAIRAKNEKAFKTEIMKTLLPDSASFKEEKYNGDDKNITAVFKSDKGYVAHLSVSGYADEISLLAGVDNSGKITGVYVLDMAETRNLGKNAAKESFLSQFKGTKGDAEINRSINSVTGATVTSKAIAKAVNSASHFVTGEDISSSATKWGG